MSARAKAVASPPAEGCRDLDQIEYRGRQWRLRTPLRVTVTYEDGIWLWEADELRLAGHGATPAAAEEMLSFDFADLWDEIACADDAELAPSAARFKKRLRDLVSEFGSIDNNGNAQG